MAQGTLRQAQDVVWGDTGEAIAPNDRRALNYRQLSAQGAIDQAQPRGSLRNPTVLRSEADREFLKPNEVFMGLDGAVEFAPVKAGEVTGEFGDSEDANRLTGPGRGAMTDIPLFQFMLNPAEKSRVEVIQRNIPDAAFARAEDGRVVVRVGDGGWRYLNAPGFSPQDLGDVGTQGLLYTPAGMAARGATGTAAALRVAGASGATSAAQDVVTGQPVDIGKAAGSAALGGLSQAAAPAVGNLLSYGGQKAAQAVPQGVKNLFAQGADDLGASFASSARGAVQQGEAPLAIPLTRGQSTGNFDQIAFEQAAARGARGQEAGNIMRGMMDDQAQAVRGVGRGLAGSETVPTLQDAGSVVQRGMRDRAQAAKREVDNAYSALRESDGAVTAPTVAELPGRMRAALEEDFFSPEVMTSLNPRTQRIFSEIERLATSAPKEGGAHVLPVAGVERVRQAINGAAASAQGNDRAALMLMRREFDGWLDDTVDNALLSGDPAAIETLKKARSLHSQYRQTYGGGRKADGAQRMMQKLIGANASETDAVNLLFGRAELSGAGEGVELVKRIMKASDGGPEVQAIREGAVMRLMGRLERNAGAGSTNVNYKALADDWAKALDGPASPLMRELFTTEERAAMRQFIGTLRRLTPPEGTVNRSGSGYEVARAAQQLSGKLKLVIPFMRGIDEAGNAVKARGALVAAPPPQSGPPLGIAGASQGAIVSGDRASGF